MAENPTSPKEPTPFEKMRALAQKVVNTPKAEADKNDREWREKKTPKPA